MAVNLVAYGSSDESESEEEGTDCRDSVVCQPTRLATSCGGGGVNVECRKSVASTEAINNVLDVELDKDKANNNGQGVSVSGTAINSSNDAKRFSLPKPKESKLLDSDFDWSSFSSRKPNGPIKISVPSLTDFDEDEPSEPVKKKIKPSKVGSGLFALLPTPKNSSANQLSKLKPQQIKGGVIAQKKSGPVNKCNRLKRNSTNLLSDNYDDLPEEEDDDYEKDATVDFFSLSSLVDSQTTDIQLPNEMDKPTMKRNEDKLRFITEKKQENNEELTGIASSVASLPFKPVENVASHSATQVEAPIRESFIGEPVEDLQLDETALQQLCGRRERRGGGPSQLVDVKGDSILPDAREWMTKQLTEEQSFNVHSHKRKDGPTTQQRRKHQITYLAFQAKEHELELKNQWANNRMSRKQTQAKYGF